MPRPVPVSSVSLVLINSYPFISFYHIVPSVSYIFSPFSIFLRIRLEGIESSGKLCDFGVTPNRIL